MPSDEGAVTVEAAIALCAVIAVLALGIAALATVSGYVRCSDAAREAARLVARGERDRAGQAVSRLAPSGAQLSVRVDGDEVSVEVSARPIGGLIAEWRLKGEAFAVLEPGAGDG